MKKQTLILLSLASLFFASCNNEKNKKEEEAKFLVTSPVQKDTMIYKDYVCQIHAMSHIEMRSQEKAYLQNIYVDEGQYVRKGQQMFQIMPVLYEAELEKSKAEVNLAEIEYQNTKNLADSNIVSKNELSMAKARLDKEKADLETFRAEKSIELSKNNAPLEVLAAVGKAETKSEMVLAGSGYWRDPDKDLDAQYKKAQIDRIYNDIKWLWYSIRSKQKR